MPASTNTTSAIDEAADRAELNTERTVQELAKRAERAIHEGIESLRSQSRGYADTAADRFDTAQRYVVDRVHEKPLTSTLTALGVGILVGMLLSGRRH
jgi:ElaB/YqjD/DUF883 family membrane-anchored ribosome-binding protein